MIFQRLDRMGNSTYEGSHFIHLFAIEEKVWNPMDIGLEPIMIRSREATQQPVQGRVVG
jgi:hypothetical protein